MYFFAFLFPSLQKICKQNAHVICIHPCLSTLMGGLHFKFTQVNTWSTWEQDWLERLSGKLTTTNWWSKSTWLIVAKHWSFCICIIIFFLSIYIYLFIYIESYDIYIFSRLVLVVLFSVVISCYFILSSKKNFAQRIVSDSIRGSSKLWGITRSTAEPEPITVSTVLAMASSDSDVPKSKQKAILGKQGICQWPVVMP